MPRAVAGPVDGLPPGCLLLSLPVPASLGTFLPHPVGVPARLPAFPRSCQVIASRPNVCKQLHMPAQSGSSAVLQAMQRGYTRESYDELVQHVRDIIPDVALR